MATLGSFPQKFETSNGYELVAENYACPVVSVTSGTVAGGYAIGPEVEPYSDVALAQDEKSVMRGPRNAAQYLRKLDTVERRKRAVSEAHTLGNIRGGIYSSNISCAVSDLLRAIENGKEDDMLYGERFAHDAREAEKELRRVTGNPNAIHYPAGLRSR